MVALLILQGQGSKNGIQKQRIEEIVPLDDIVN